MFTMQHRVILQVVLAYSVELFDASDNLSALVTRHDLLLLDSQRAVQIVVEVLFVAGALEEAALIVHAHEMSILIPVLNEVLLVAG